MFEIYRKFEGGQRVDHNIATHEGATALLGGRIDYTHCPLPLRRMAAHISRTKLVDPVGPIMAILPSMTAMMGPNVQIHDTPGESGRPVSDKI
jgi:hypothetical protein